MSTRRLNNTRAKSSSENQNLVTYHTKGRDAIRNLRKRKIAGVLRRAPQPAQRVFCSKPCCGLPKIVRATPVQTSRSVESIPAKKRQDGICRPATTTYC